MKKHLNFYLKYTVKSFFLFQINNYVNILLKKDTIQAIQETKITRTVK